MGENDKKILKATDNTKKFQRSVEKINTVKIQKNYKILDDIVDCVRVRIEKEDRYLSEFGTGEYDAQYGKMTFRVISEKERNASILAYNDTAAEPKLFDSNGDVATTHKATSKGIDNLQAFVMSKEGVLYVATHAADYYSKDPSLTHASFLGGKPAEMAGMIRIEDGEIVGLSRFSGHYGTKGLDMYRGIKKLQKSMPDAFSKDAVLFLNQKYTEDRTQTIANFIQEMEIIQENGKTVYENGREERKQQYIDEYKKITGEDYTDRENEKKWHDLTGLLHDKAGIAQNQSESQSVQLNIGADVQKFQQQAEIVSQKKSAQQTKKVINQNQPKEMPNQQSPDKGSWYSD